MTVRVSERELSITSISSQETKLYDYAPEAGFGAGQYGYISEPVSYTHLLSILWPPTLTEHGKKFIIFNL